MKTKAIEEERISSFFRRIAFCYLVLLVLSLLMPFDFAPDLKLVQLRLKRLFSIWPAKSFFEATFLADFFQNIILFVPFGFFLRLAGRKLRLVCAAGFATSFAVETTQLFLDSRVSSGYDFITNGFGTFLGAALLKPCGEPVKKATSFLLSIRPRPKTGIIASLFYAACVFILLLAPFAPACFERWDPHHNLYFGGVPRDRSFWQGTVSAIEVFYGNDSRKGSAPKLKIDFRDRNFQSDILKGGPLPRGVSLSPEGITFKGGYLKAPQHLAEAFFSCLNSPRPFKIRLRINHTFIGRTQEGMVICWGSEIKEIDFCVRQEGRTLFLFLKSGISKDNWDQPRAKFKDAVSEEGTQVWEFSVGKDWIKLFVNGKDVGRTFYLGHYSSPVGIILASPVVSEPVSLTALILLPLGWLLYLSFGRLSAFLISSGLFEALLCLGSLFLGFRPDRDIVSGSCLGLFLGFIVSKAWNERGLK